MVKIFLGLQTAKIKKWKSPSQHNSALLEGGLDKAEELELFQNIEKKWDSR